MLIDIYRVFTYIRTIKQKKNIVTWFVYVCFICLHFCWNIKLPEISDILLLSNQSVSKRNIRSLPWSAITHAASLLPPQYFDDEKTVNNLPFCCTWRQCVSVPKLLFRQLWHHNDCQIRHFFALGSVNNRNAAIGEILTWKPACATSWALTKCVSWLAFKNRSSASTLKMCAVPRRVFTAKPSLARSSIANLSFTVFGLKTSDIF